MKTTIEVNNKVASIYISTIIALNMSGEISLLNQPVEDVFSGEDMENLSATGIDFSDKTAKDALLFVRDWLNEVEIA